MASSNDNQASSAVLQCHAERDFLLEGCRDNCRIDGRARDEFRMYSIVTGSDVTISDANNNNNNNNSNNNNIGVHQQPPLILSNGSARLVSTTNGGGSDLHMLCSIKAEIVYPTADQPDKGVVELHVEGISSMGIGSNNNRQKRRKEDEVQTLLQQLVLNHLVDHSSLCIVPGHFVWRLHVDLYLLAATSGSLLDSASHVIRAALQNTLLPSIAPISKQESTPVKDDDGDAKSSFDLTVDGDITKAQPPAGAQRAPSVVTITILQCPSITTTTTTTSTAAQQSSSLLILDATAEEEAISYAQVHVAVDVTARAVCSIAKSGSGALSPSVLPECVTMAVQAAADCKNYVYRTLSEEKGFMLLQDQFAIQ